MRRDEAPGEGRETADRVHPITAGRRGHTCRGASARWRCFQRVVAFLFHRIAAAQPQRSLLISLALISWITAAN